MSDVIVQEFEKGQLSRLVSAEKGEWIDGSWWLEEEGLRDNEGQRCLAPLHLDKQALQLNLNPEEAARTARTPDEMTLNELFREINMMKQKGMDVSKIVMILNLRFSVPWACLVLAIVGAAVGSRPQRSSSGMGLGLSVIIVFVYYVILSFTSSWRCRLPPPGICRLDSQYRIPYHRGRADAKGEQAGVIFCLTRSIELQAAAGFLNIWHYPRMSLFPAPSSLKNLALQGRPCSSISVPFVKKDLR